MRRDNGCRRRNRLSVTLRFGTIGSTFRARQRHLVVGAGPRYDGDAGAGLHDHFHGFDVVGDREDVRADAEIGEQREHDLAVADRQFAHHDRFGDQLAHIDRFAAAGQGMLGRHDQHHLGCGQALEHQAGGNAIRIGFDGDAGIEPFLVQVIEDRFGRRGQNLQPNARQDGFEFAEQPRHENLRHARTHADGQRIGRRAAQPPGGVGEAHDVADDALGLVEESAAALGHLDAARRAAEQRKPDLVFQLLDLFADGGLGNIKTDGCVGEAALLRHGEGVSDLAKVHVWPLVLPPHPAWRRGSGSFSSYRQLLGKLRSALGPLRTFAE